MDAVFTEAAQAVSLSICLSGRLGGGNPAYWTETLRRSLVSLHFFLLLLLIGTRKLVLLHGLVEEKCGTGTRTYERARQLAWRGVRLGRWRTHSVLPRRTRCDLRAYGDRCEDSCGRRASVVWLPLSGFGLSCIWVFFPPAYWHVVTSVDGWSVAGEMGWCVCVLGGVGMCGTSNFLTTLSDSFSSQILPPLSKSSFPSTNELSSDWTRPSQVLSSFISWQKCQYAS